MDADRHECPRLSEACAAVVEKRRSGRNGRENAAAGDGQPGGGNGPGDGASRTRRNGKLRAEAQREGRSGEMADRQRRAVEEAGERKAERRNDRLRKAPVGVERRQGSLTDPRAGPRGQERRGPDRMAKQV